MARSDWPVEKPKSKVRKINTDSKLWKRRYKTVVETYLPRIVNCGACGSPRHHSYICQFCGEE